MALNTLYFLVGFSLCLQAFGGWESNHICMSNGHINWQFFHAHTFQNLLQFSLDYRQCSTFLNSSLDYKEQAHFPIVANHKAKNATSHCSIYIVKLPSQVPRVVDHKLVSKCYY